MNYCPKCGKKIDGDYNYCPSCGASLQKVSESSAVNSQMHETPKTKYSPARYEKYKNINFSMPLLCVIAESFFLIIGNIVMYDMSVGFAWTMIIVYILSTVGSIVGLVTNIVAMKKGIKGKAIAGLILSIIGLFMGSVFIIGAIIGFAGY